MIANGYGVSFGGDEKVRELESSEYTKNYKVYSLKGWLMWYVNNIYFLKKF